MEWIKVLEEPHKLIDRVLADNVISSEGLTLLKEGMIVRARHIPMLRRNGVDLAAVGEYASVTDQLDQKFHQDYPGFAKAYKKQFMQLKDVFTRIQNDEPADLEEAVAGFEELLKETMNSVNLFEVLQQMQGHNDYTYRHSIHVALFGALLANLLKLPEEQVVDIGYAGLLHDIGKIRVSNAIIDKPEKLNDEEFSAIKKHCELGYELLINYTNVNQTILDGTLSHHERMDGSGYPFGIREADIPLTAKILGVVDVFDAISSDRAYHKKSSPLHALSIIIKELYNGKLSIEYGLPFVNYMLDVYTASDVILSDGRLAKIVRIDIHSVENPLIQTNDGVFLLQALEGVEVMDIADRHAKKVIENH